MKKQLCLLLVFCVLSTHQVINNIPIVTTTALRGSRSPPSFEVEWRPVDDNRVLGYKVKAWEIPEKLTTVLEVLFNGTEVPKMTKTFDLKVLDSVPETNPDFVINVPGAQSKTAKLENLKIDQYYQIYVLAYAKDGEGPPSFPNAVKIPK